MTPGSFRHIYGPVPSRRLGRSMGIDLVPFKTCTYDCIYCQLGRTTNKAICRREYVSIADILSELQDKLAKSEAPDYISLAGSGEPTLNSGIGELIVKIKSLTNIPIAVLTNGSLLWMSDVQDALMAADLVLPSLDAGNDRLFQYVNRPHKDISFEQMINGLITFTKRFQGKVWLEVFLLGGVMENSAEVEQIASIVRQINPARTQLNTVFRPTAEEFAIPLPADQMVTLKSFFPGHVDIINENEQDSAKTPVTHEVREGEILALLGRRPCTSADIANGLNIHVTEALKDINALISTGKITTARTGGRAYYTIVNR